MIKIQSHSKVLMFFNFCIDALLIFSCRAKVYLNEILGSGSDDGSNISGHSSVSELEIRQAAEVKIDHLLSSQLHYI